MERRDINNLGLSELQTLYSIISEICSEYSKMTDGYSLATGDNKFEDIPNDIFEMIKDRQKFYSYKLIIKNILINKIKKEMESYGFE